MSHAGRTQREPAEAASSPSRRSRGSIVNDRTQRKPAVCVSPAHAANLPRLSQSLAVAARVRTRASRAVQVSSDPEHTRISGNQRGLWVRW
jgi:hypothetical protein